jgi:hypothetical protein
MPKVFCCRCEVERIEIAGGRIVAICLTCEAYGNEAELAAGGRFSPPAAPPIRAFPRGWRATVEAAKRFTAAAPEPAKRRASAGGSARIR